MKQTVFLLLLLGGLLGAAGCSDHDNRIYDPAAYFDSAGQEAFKYRIARYITHLPKKAVYDTRFDTAFDAAYRHAAAQYRLEAYHEAPDGYHYFMVSRVAPSLKQKRVATGGRLKYAADTTSIEAYEEIFRTWKMEEDELREKSYLLFDKMVLQEDLSRYYTENSPKEDYIEFPDKNTRYNKELRRWEGVVNYE